MQRAHQIEAEARSLISWARKYTKLTKYLREPEMRQVVADARAAVDRWRGAYASRGGEGAPGASSPADL